MAVTDYIAIRGLKTSDQEVFRGIGGSSSSAPSTPGDGDDADLDWGEIPEDVVTTMIQYTEDLNSWMSQMSAAAAPADGSRNLPAIPPAVPALLTALATGGASLPAVATVLVSQAVVNIVGSALQNLAQRFDPNSLESIVRKALLYKDGDGTEQSVLNDRLSDLAYVDTVLDFGPFRAHIRGKMIEY